MRRQRKLHRLTRSQEIPRPLDDVFGFFSDASNLEALTPAFLHFRFLTPLPVRMESGSRIDYSLSILGVPVRWRTRIVEWVPGVRFVDVQESGPYAYWRHMHSFHAVGAATLMSDTVDYALPLGPLGQLAHLLFVRPLLRRIFDYRSEAVRRLLGDGALFMRAVREV